MTETAQRPDGLVPGAKCRVKRGALAGHDVTLVGIDHRGQATVRMELFGSEIPVEIRSDHLERID